MLLLTALTAFGAKLATSTVRNVDDGIARRLRVGAAEHGRSAEAEHREILRVALMESDPHAARERAAERLAEFRRRTAGPGSASSGELLHEVRSERMRALTGASEDT
jgi:antitoxin FitA